jgi:GNAT superfamily N-acetyltransferase/ribosomal protein L37E
MIFVMTVIKVVVHGYLEAAERIGRWSWLYGDRWVKNRFVMTRPDGKTAKMPRPVNDDYVFITKLDEEVIATIVLRVVDVRERDPDIVAMNKRQFGNVSIKDRDRDFKDRDRDELYVQKKVSFRAWTVKQRYRGQGVGLALLRFVVRWALDSDLDVLLFADDHAHSLRVLPAFLNKKMDSQDERVRDKLYWEVKHYSTPWHMEQREKKKAVLRAAEVKAQKVEVEEKTSPDQSWGFYAARGGCGARSLLTEMLAPMKSFTPQPSRSSWGPMNDWAIPERVASVPPSRHWSDPETEKDDDQATVECSVDWGEGSGFTPDDAETASKEGGGHQAINDQYRPSWFDPETEKDVDEATAGCSGDSDEGSGWTPDEAETASKEGVDHQAINDQYMRDVWEEWKHAPKRESHVSWGEAFTPAGDSRPGPSTLNTWSSLRFSGQENSSPATASTATPKNTQEETGKPFGPRPSYWADPLREEILRRSSTNLRDRQTHISCESCGRTVTQTDRVNMSNVGSPPGVWFGPHSRTRLCSSCGLHRIRESIDRLERSARSFDGW